MMVSLEKVRMLLSMAILGVYVSHFWLLFLPWKWRLGPQDEDVDWALIMRGRLAVEQLEPLNHASMFCFVSFLQALGCRIMVGETGWFPARSHQEKPVADASWLVFPLQIVGGWWELVTNNIGKST